MDSPALWYLNNQQGYQHLANNPRPGGREKRRGRLTCRYRLVPDFVAKGSVLEIGCAAGNRLALLKRLGWETCLGSEYSEEAAQTARSRGLQVISGPVEEMLDSVPDQSLHAIIAGFVIEHVTNPFALVRKFATKLKPGGQFVFNTININSPDFWFYGPHWYDLDLPRHMVFFRRRDLWDMLSPDFKVEHVEYQSALNDYLGSARYRQRDNLRGWKDWVDFALLRMGARLERPLRWVARAGLGGRIFIHARKKAEAAV